MDTNIIAMYIQSAITSIGLGKATNHSINSCFFSVYEACECLFYHYLSLSTLFNP